MVSKEKLYTKLGLLEVELEERLIHHLEKAAIGNNDLIFCVVGFNPFPKLKSRTDVVTEELVDIGAQILALKNKLGVPSEGSIAERICWYCQEWGKTQKGNTENNLRKKAQELAKQFLEEIKNT